MAEGGRGVRRPPTQQGARHRVRRRRVRDGGEAAPQRGVTAAQDEVLAVADDASGDAEVRGCQGHVIVGDGGGVDLGVPGAVGGRAQGQVVAGQSKMSVAASTSSSPSSIVALGVADLRRK